MEIVSRGNSEHYNWGEVCDGWHLLKADKLSVIEERVPPDVAEVRHYHERAYQFLYVLSGEATVENDGQTLTIGPYQGLSVPPGTTHRLLNESQQELILITISAPMNHGDRIVVS